MKKLGIFLLLLTVLAAFAVAQDRGPDPEQEIAADKEKDLLGLDAGAEFSFGDVADEVIFGIAPIIKYDNSFGDFDVYVEAQYFFVFDSDLIQYFYLEEEVAYNLPVGPGVLSFIVNNQNNFYIDDPNSADDYDGVVEPSIKYAQEFKFGTLFLQPGFPIYYAPDAVYDVYLNLGYYNFGFGIELKGIYNLDPVGEMAGYELLLNYEKEDLLYAEVEVDTDNEFDAFTISPYAEFYLKKRITVWAGVDFYNVAGEGDVIVEPYIGASYKF